MQNLLLQLVPRKIVYDLTYIFRVIPYRVDHAGNDERELDFKERLCRPVVFAWYQVARTDPVCCIYEEALFGNGGFRRRIQVDRELDLGGKRCRLVVIAWCYLARTHRVCRLNEEALFGDAGSRRRIQADRRLQQLPAPS